MSGQANNQIMTIVRMGILIVMMGLIGVGLLLALPDIEPTPIVLSNSSLPLEPVNTQIRDVTPDHTLPGPDITKQKLSRLPAANLPAPSKNKPEQATLRNGKILSAGVVVYGERVVRIRGISPLPLAAFCQTSSNGRWPCGKFARTAFQKLIRGRPINCLPNLDKQKPNLMQCNIASKDIGEWLVARGWARDAGGGYLSVMQEAKILSQGMWRQVAP